MKKSQSKRTNYQLNIVESKDIWDRFVTSSKEYSFLQSWDQGELASAMGHEVFRYVFLDNKTGDNLFVFQFQKIKAKRGAIIQLRHGPVLLPDYHSLDENQKNLVTRSFLIELKYLAEASGYDFIRLQPLLKIGSEDFIIFEKEMKNLGFLHSNIHNIDAEKTLILDIDKSKYNDEELLQNMRKQTRYYIRKAAKMGVSMEVSTDESAVEDFFKIHVDTTIRQNFKSYSLNYYQKLVKELDAQVYSAFYKEEKIASAIIVHFGKKAFYSDGGSLTEYSNVPASYAIQWRAICDAREKNLETYNFWGGVSPDIKNKKYPWYGIDLFKRGFGGERIEYMHAHDLPISKKYYLIRLWEWIEKKKRGY